VWFEGRDERGAPLRHADLAADVSASHFGRTVSRDPHPHLGRRCAYVHPCRHAATLARLARTLGGEGGAEGGGDAGAAADATHPERAVLLLLRFVSTVLPTVAYDNTWSAGG